MILIYLSVLKHNTLEQNLKSNLICCKRAQNKINLCTLLVESYLTFSSYKNIDDGKCTQNDKEEGFPISIHIYLFININIVSFDVPIGHALYEYCNRIM
ncbi:hypothetical protein BLOT_007374 [Blomia tropicalis]|nr:hypothetical protein BLOT_007374 [Blomia tropicalis]